jgi:hypothetical protein
MIDPIITNSAILSEYLKKHDKEIDIETLESLIYSFGMEKTEDIVSEAIKESKYIKIEEKRDELDGLEYELL